MMTSPNNDNFSSSKIKVTLETLTRDFVKVWPLQNFIACNPLLNYEHLPFSEALINTQVELKWHNTSLSKDFQRWYQQGALVTETLRHQFEQTKGSDCDLIFNIDNQDISLKEILWADLISDLQESVSPEIENQSLLYSMVESIHTQTNPEYEFTPSESSEELINSLSDWVGLLTDQPLSAWIDELMVKWLTAYLDNGQAILSMPNRNLGLRFAWEQLVIFDTHLKKENRQELKKIITSLPDNSYEAIGSLLTQIGVKPENIKLYLKEHLSRLPGWVGYMRWHIDQMEKNGSHQKIQTRLLADYLVLRLCYEVVLCKTTIQKHFGCSSTIEALQSYFQDRPKEYYVKRYLQEIKHLPQLLKNRIKAHQWEAASAQLQDLLYSQRLSKSVSQLTQRLEALTPVLFITPSQMRSLMHTHGTAILKALQQFNWPIKNQILRETMETDYQNKLLSILTHNVLTVGSPNNSTREPIAQAVFCIDVRSEQFRLKLETSGEIHTLGFAGFFGIPAKLKAFGENCGKDLCPVLLTPRYVIEEEPLAHEQLKAKKYLSTKKSWQNFTSLLFGLMKNSASTFSYVEAFGLGHAVAMVFKTLMPQWFSQNWNRTLTTILPFVSVKPNLLPKADTVRNAYGLVQGITLEEQVYFAAVSLSMMGLKNNFCRIVILCGHGTQVANNPYASSLDCGACGGNHGGSSAHILAEILNNALVKESLMAQGIFIPAETIFLAAEHNTATDDVVFLNLQQYQSQLETELPPILKAFKMAALLNRKTRAKHLPTINTMPFKATDALLRNAVDWSQVRPEWGLAQNAAMIIAPRKLTQGLDLAGRAFLHSYDWKSDPEGKALENILTAPLIVAEWINMQYLFSLLDNNRFGSGSKTVHNVVGQLGVMLGNASDLQIGLSMQSVMVEEGSAYHLPLRLTAVVNAPMETITAIIRKHFVLQNLFNNQWVHLVVLDPKNDEFLQYCPHETWRPWRNPSHFLNPLHASDTDILLSNKRL